MPPERPKAAFDRYYEAHMRDPVFAAAYAAARKEIDRERASRHAPADWPSRRRRVSDRSRAASRRARDSGQDARRPRARRARRPAIPRRGRSS